MKAQILKIAGVKSEKEFYKKYPTEEAFFKAHPEAAMMQKQSPKMQFGGGFGMGMVQDKQNELLGMADSMQKKYGPMLMQLAPMLLQDGGELTPEQLTQMQQKQQKANQAVQAAEILTNALMKKGGSTYSGGVWFQDGGESKEEDPMGEALSHMKMKPSFPKYNEVEAVASYIPGLETAIDLKDIIAGAATGDYAQMQRGKLGLGLPVSGKAIMTAMDLASPGSAAAINEVANMSKADHIKLFKKYGYGGYDQWVKAGRPKLKKGGSTYSGGVWFQDGGNVVDSEHHYADLIKENPVKGFFIDGVAKAWQGAEDALTGAGKTIGKGVARFAPANNQMSVEDRERIFNDFRPVEYPGLFNTATKYIQHVTGWGDKKPPIRDSEGDYQIGEEAWRRALNLDTKNKYIQQSRYKPSTATDPNAQYYRVSRDVIDPQKFIDYVKSGEFDKRKQRTKNGKNEYVQMSSMSPFLRENFMPEEEFEQIDPLQRFQIFRGYDDKKKMPYVSYADTYNFDFAPVNKMIKPYDFYDRFYYYPDKKKKGGSTYSGGVWFEDGGIHINPANKGKFTASAQNAGMGVQEFAAHVLANKEDYSSTQVKRANFARNASKWKHQFGGNSFMPNLTAKDIEAQAVNQQLPAEQQIEQQPAAANVFAKQLQDRVAKDNPAFVQAEPPMSKFNKQLGAVQNKLAEGMAGDPWVGAIGNIIEGINNKKDYNAALDKQKQRYSTDYAYNTSYSTAANKGQYDMYGTMMPNQIGGNLSFNGMNQKYNMTKNMFEQGGQYEISSLSLIPQELDIPKEVPFFVAAPKSNTYEMVPTTAAPAVENITRMNFNLSGNFQDYATKAQNYLNKVAPNTDIKGVDLAGAAQEAYQKHGKVVPVELALAQLKQEGYLANGSKPNKPQRTKNPFNVGNTDNGDVVSHSSLYSGIRAYYNLMASQYLKNKSPEQLLENFTNSNGNRYASDKRYENSLKDIIGSMKLKEGGEYDLTEDQIQHIMRMGGEIEYC